VSIACGYPVRNVQTAFWYWLKPSKRVWSRYDLKPWIVTDLIDSRLRCASGNAFAVAATAAAVAAAAAAAADPPVRRVDIAKLPAVAAVARKKKMRAK